MEDKNEVMKSQTKEAYEKPLLTEHGSVRELTQGGPGTKTEAHHNPRT